MAGGVRAAAARLLRRWADRLAPIEVPVERAPGLSDPTQAAVRLVIAATREESAEASLRAAYGVLERVDGSLLPSVALQLAVLAARQREPREEVRARLEYVLTGLRFWELVEPGVLGDG